MSIEVLVGAGVVGGLATGCCMLHADCSCAGASTWFGVEGACGVVTVGG